MNHHHHGNSTAHRHKKRTTTTTNTDMFQGRNFILKSNSVRKACSSSDGHDGKCVVEETRSYFNSRKERLETLIVPAASPSSPEIIFNVLAPKLMNKESQEASTSCFSHFPIETLKESEFKFVTPKSRENATTACPTNSAGGVSSTIGDIITPSLFEAIYDDTITPNTNITKSSRKSEIAQPNSSPEISLGSLPSDILSSPENIVSSPPLFASRVSSDTNSSSSSSSPTASPKKKKVKLNDKSFEMADFNLVSQESKVGSEKSIVGNFDIQSHSRVFAFEFRLNDLSCEIEEIVCVELLKNGIDFQETGIRFHASIIQKADVDGNGKSYLTDAVTNLSRLIYSNNFFNVDQSPKIVTRSHGKKMDMLLDTLQNIIIGDTFDSYSFLNNLFHLLSEQTIYLYESFKDNIKPLCNEQEILNYFSISANSSNWMCQTCSSNNSTVCSLVECSTTSLLFQRMFQVIEKKRNATQNTDQQQLDDSVISINIDYEEVLNAIKTPPNDFTPKSKNNSTRSGKKFSKIKISPRGIISASNTNNSNSKDAKKSLQLAIRNSPKKSKTIATKPTIEKENTEIPIVQPVECPKIQFVLPQRTSETASPKTVSSAKLTILKKNNPPIIEWTDQKVEELLTPKTVAILHFFSTCRQKNLDSFFKSPKSSMILQMRPFLSIKDLVNKFSEHPCLGLTNLAQFCKTTFGL